MKSSSCNIHKYATVIISLLSIIALLLSAFSLLMLIKYSSSKKSDKPSYEFFNNLSKSVVAVSCGVDTENDILTSDISVGSGFFVDILDNGINDHGHNEYKYLIATANHNITSDKPVIFRGASYYGDEYDPNGGYDSIFDENTNWYEAEIEYSDPISDIAIISYTEEIYETALPLSETAGYILNDDIYSICTPKTLFLANTLLEGKITRSGVNGLANQYLIMTDLPLSPGCSGSPIINKSGKVIGMNLFKSTEFGTEGMSFAASAKKIAEALDNCKNGITPTDYGIKLSESFKTEYGFINYGQNQGMIVKDISEDSIFKNTELKVGYTIFAVNGRNLYTYADFYENMTPNADILYYNPDIKEYKEFKLAG